MAFNSENDGYAGAAERVHHDCGCGARDVSASPVEHGGGGAGDLRQLLESRGRPLVEASGCDVGFGAISGEDNCFVLDAGVQTRQRLSHFLPLVLGDSLRDWTDTLITRLFGRIQPQEIGCLNPKLETY